MSKIYRQNLWGSKESLSGSGSEIKNTEKLRLWLINNIPSLEIANFVDAPCGDFNWMKLVLPHLNLRYVGLDIVDSVIQRNKLNFENDKIRFQVANICEDVISKCDLIMVRDCLHHLSYKDIERFLKNLERTDYKYLFTTSHIKRKDEFHNKNIISGDGRALNLFKEPFNFVPDNIMERVLDYHDGYRDRKEMLLIEKKYVPTELSFY